MLSLEHPEILSHLAQLVYGLQPVRLHDGSFLLIVKAGKDSILTAKLNNGFKLYLIPDSTRPGQALGFVSAFFDDDDEPLVMLTPLFAGDALFTELVATLSQNEFKIYLFDEHDRELIGAIAKLKDADRFIETIATTNFPQLDRDHIHDTYDEMISWFGLRTAMDDAAAYPISLGVRLYPDDMAIIDVRDDIYDFHGSDGVVISTSLEREDPGPYQEQDIVALLRRAFPGTAIFLNPIREDTGKELCDVLVVSKDFLIIVQAKDSPNTGTALGRPISRKRSVIRSHIEKGARQLRGALSHCVGRHKLLLRVSSEIEAIAIDNRAVLGIVVVRELFDDDYHACSQPVLAVAKLSGEACVLLEYAAFHMLTRRLPTPNRLMNGLRQLFEAALANGEYPKPRFTAGPEDLPP